MESVSWIIVWYTSYVVLSEDKLDSEERRKTSRQKTKIQ